MNDVGESGDLREQLDTTRATRYFVGQAGFIYQGGFTVCRRTTTKEVNDADGCGLGLAP